MGTWEEIFESGDTTYSEKIGTQNQLFELVKLQFLVSIFPPEPVKTLEVGCGAARTSLYFAKRGYKTTLLDQSKKVLGIAKKNYKKESSKGTFIVGDAEKLPFKANSFDVVMSFGLLEHFKDPPQAIDEMGRVLKPGGLFFADIVPKRFSVQTIGNVFNFAFSVCYWSLRLRPRTGLERGIRNFRPIYYENSLSWQEYKKFIKKAGIKSVEVRGNRPFPRLTLPGLLDRACAFLMKLFLPFWRKFDSWDSFIPRFWGAGWWLWGTR